MGRCLGVDSSGLVQCTVQKFCWTFSGKAADLRIAGNPAEIRIC